MSRRCMFVLFALVALRPVSAATVSATVRQELQQRYTKVMAAYKAKDIDAFMEFFDTDLKVRTPAGHRLDYDEFKAFTKEQMAITQTFTSGRIVREKVTVEGEEATVHGTENWVYTFKDEKGEFGSKGRSYSVLWKQRVRATLAKTDKGWLARRLDYEGPLNLTMRGKRLRPIAKSE